MTDDGPVPGCQPGDPLDPSKLPEDVRLAVWLDRAGGRSQRAGSLADVPEVGSREFSEPTLATREKNHGMLARDIEALAQKLDGRSPDEPPLPIVVDLGLRQLGLQYDLVRDILQPLGMWPDEVLWLHRRDGTAIWLWHARCDLELLEAAAQRWKLRKRATVEGVVLEPQRSLSGVVPNDPFPYDLVGLPGDRWLLTPAGSGTASARWLLEGSPREDADAGAAADTPGTVLAKLQPGAVRAVAATTGLLLAGDDSANRALFTLRAHAGEVEVSSP